MKLKLPLQRMIRAPCPWTKHSQGEKRWEGGQDVGPDSGTILMLSRAAAAAAAAVRGVLASGMTAAAGAAGAACTDGSAALLAIGSA